MPGKPTSPRLRRRPRRGHPRHHPIRQAPRRAPPLGLQQAVPRRDHHLRRQQPPRQPLGREDLQRRPRQRQRPPHATRILARAWIRVIGAAGSTASPTDPLSTEPPQRSPDTRPGKSPPEVDTGSVIMAPLPRDPRVWRDQAGNTLDPQALGMSGSAAARWAEHPASAMGWQAGTSGPRARSPPAGTGSQRTPRSRDELP